MFDAVNEVAVLGTTFFMMAAGTVWYSPMLFGKTWLKELRVTEEEIEKTRQYMWRQVALTFMAYATMLTLVAHMVAYTPLLGLTPVQGSFLLTFFAAALSLASAVWENRSIRYYAINVGFYSFLVIGGTFIIDYWPW